MVVTSWSPVRYVHAGSRWASRRRRSPRRSVRLPSPYRTWDAGRRATPLKMLARARALATHRDDHALLPLPVLALLIGVHVKTLRAAARDGRLPVTYDTRTTFRRLRAARHWRLLASFAIPTLDDRCGEQTGESRRVGRACQPTTMYRFARCVVRAG